jgi:hypothetical protein
MLSVSPTAGVYGARGSVHGQRADMSRLDQNVLSAAERHAVYPSGTPAIRIPFAERESIPARDKDFCGRRWTDHHPISRSAASVRLRILPICAIVGAFQRDPDEECSRFFDRPFLPSTRSWMAHIILVH